jgi:dephospho-CoA kinase
MLRVGLTGGLASGKSTVGRMFESYGCLLVQADALGHQVLEPDGAAFRPAIALFGEAILQNGRIDRKALGRIVFSEPEKLERLNAIVHPLVFQLEDRALDDYEQTNPHGIAIVEAAILIETGSYRRFHKIVLAVCSETEQIRRAMARDGLTEAEVRTRLARQMPLERKRKFADYIIDTSGPVAETEKQARIVFDQLRSATA